MARVQRTVADVETWALVVNFLPAEIVRAGSFAAEDLEAGYLVTMDAAAAEAVDLLLADLPGLRRRALVAHAADLRWRREVAGLAVAGIPVATDDRSKLMITGARLAALDNPGWTTIWHGADGGSYQLDATAILAISSAVEAHVNACFERFAEVKGLIEAGTVTSRAQVEAEMAA